MILDAKMVEYATPAQAEALQAYLEHGSYAKAGAAIGIATEAVRDRLRCLARRAAQKGYAPGHDVDHPAAPGFHVKGYTDGRRVTYADGSKGYRYMKYDKDRENELAAWREALDAMLEKYRGIVLPEDEPKDHDDDLLLVVPIADPHIGMLSWGKETGQDYDLKIAEATVMSLVSRLFARVPPATHCLVINVGDWTHASDDTARTPRGQNPLDTDSRFGKMFDVGLRVQRAVFDLALQKHQRVTGWFCPGNHDGTAGLAMARSFAMMYENEPRLTIPSAVNPMHVMRFGQCLIASTHGEARMVKNLDRVLATDHAEDWGATKWRRWYIGHKHSESVIDRPGCTIETLNAVAARDAWAHRELYRSDRGVLAEWWHYDKGRRGRIFEWV